ncbi:helix-turn-helix domain-containing protein [Nocardiopsis sp. NPDC101807]|uniref:helix-turn-helix domain-containing protein n=1 Tax=Nocardiopsis sp. NPDC101807 TaxID=3364339 RepID=UPI0038186554
MSQATRPVRDPELLDRLMSGARLSNRELARRVKCSHQMIAALRTGARKSCSPGLAESISAKLRVDAEVLFLPTLSPVGDKDSRSSDEQGEATGSSPRALTIPDAALRLGCSRQHVYRLINNGALPTIDIASPGARRTKQRVTTTALQHYLDALHRSPANSDKATA